MKNLPIYHNDSPIGTLDITHEGLYTRFTASLPGRPGLWRLWLMGEGRVPLGIMEPGKEQMRLSRRLSKKELSKVKDPERALLLPIDAEPPPEEKAAYPSAGSADSSPDKGSQTQNLKPPSCLPQSASLTAPSSEGAKDNSEHCKESIWTSRPDGSFYRRLGNSWLIALPAAESLRHPALSFIYINGKKYTLLRY